MSVYCDIKTLEGVEHSKSKRNTQLRFMFLSLLFSCSTSSIVFISQYRDMSARFIFFKYIRAGWQRAASSLQIILKDFYQKVKCIY